MRQIALLANLDREGVRLMTNELRDLVDCGEPILLDGAQVERVGMPAIQLLLSAMRLGPAGEADVQLVNPSEALVQAATLAGVADLIGLAGDR